MGSSSSQLSEPPSSPPRTPPREHGSLRRSPFKDPEATPPAARRSRSISSSPATRFSYVERRLTTLPDSSFRPLVGAIAHSLPEGVKWSKEKGKGGATQLSHDSGCKTASMHDADDWSDSDGDANDEECDSPVGESLSSTPTPALAAAECANARQGPPDPTFAVDRQMSAYELEKRF